ncbi:MAG: DUF5320 domain-containing protein [Firmicutes bacterium]|nr:DUF5320 domain-containing protein [Bacillota bacterium]
MPGRDGTGPLGAGPLTGGGFGWCADARGLGYGAGCGVGFGRGFACRRGFGGFGRGFLAAPLAVKDQKELLEKEKEFLQNRLQKIDQELENLE